MKVMLVSMGATPDPDWAKEGADKPIISIENTKNLMRYES
jgi:hypothetical protein